MDYSDLSLVTDESGKLMRYAWPGGYDIAYLTEDGAYLCASCANTYRDPEDSQWHVVGFDVSDSWDDAEPCEHCGTILGPNNQ